MQAVVTKRHLGIVISVVGVLVMAGVAGADLLDLGRWGGFGPLQRISVGLCLLSLAVGFILMRLGNRPA